jgi:Holliday junction resolvase
MGEKGQNTNLASEFYVLSMLHRLGANAVLTPGNKKSVDIVVEKNGETLTIDVKGLRDKSCFPLDNWNKKNRGHFLVFVSFLNKIDDPKSVPRIWIIPAEELDKASDKLIYINPKGNRKVINFGKLKEFCSEYEDKWEYFK